MPHLNRQQRDVALRADGQHLGQELLVVPTPLHLHLQGQPLQRERSSFLKQC